MMLLMYSYLIATCVALCRAQANEVEYGKIQTSTYDEDSSLTEVVLHEDEELYDLSELKEKNMCIHVEKVKEDIVKPVTIPVEENVTYWCFNIPPKCTKTKIKYVETNKTYSVIKTKKHQVCCKGYEKVNGTCEPICIGGCGRHGECKSPGTCSCDKGWKGSKCTEECEAGTYGLYCNSTCSCFNDGMCDKVNGTCLCPPGFTGLFCEHKCHLDFYGEDCENNCSCLNGAECDVHNGTCLCLPGYAGKQCENKCLEGKYGMKCMLNCTCDVDTTEFCRPVDGKCFCLPGYTGERCEQKCSTFHWGANCEKSCDCRKNTTCDHITGQCFCPPGWHGAECDKACPEDKWGNDCNKSCSCDIGSCDPATGQCVCLAGWMGDDCSIICPPGLYGLNCKNNCSCSYNATCNPVDGKCPCDTKCQEEILNMVWKRTGDHSSSTVSSTTADKRNGFTFTLCIGLSVLGLWIIGLLIVCYTMIGSKKTEWVSRNQLSSENKNREVAEDTGSALCVRFANHIYEAPNISDNANQSQNNAGDYDMVLLNFERKEINTTKHHTKRNISKPEAQRMPLKENIHKKKNIISYTKDLKSQNKGIKEPNEKLYSFDSSDECPKLKKKFIGRLQKSQSISYDDFKMHKKFSMGITEESKKDSTIYFTNDTVERLVMNIENDSKFSNSDIDDQGKKTEERKEEKKQEKKDLNNGIVVTNFVEASDKPVADLYSCNRDYVLPQASFLANEGVLIKNENFPQISDHGQYEEKNDKTSVSTLPTSNDILRCLAIRTDRNVKSIKATVKYKPGKTEIYGSVSDADCKTSVASNDVENCCEMMKEDEKCSSGKERKQDKALSEKENESEKDNVRSKLAI